MVGGMAGLLERLRVGSAARRTGSTEDGVPVVVVGGERRLKQHLRLLCALGLRPLAYLPTESTMRQKAAIRIDADEVASIAHEAGLDGYVNLDRVPVVDSDTLRSILRRHRPVIVSGRIDTGDDVPPGTSVSHARSAVGVEHAVVHLSALCDLYASRTPRLLLAGMPGAGNVIFQLLLRAMLQGDGAPRLNSVERMLARVSKAYMREVGAGVERLMGDVAPGRAVVPNVNLRNSGSCTVWFGDTSRSAEERVALKPPDVIVAGLRFNGHMWADPVHASHEPLPASTIDFYRSNGYVPVAILRHPLDILVSIARKLSFGADRATTVAALLSSPRWFGEILGAIEAHYRHLAENRSRLRFVRYEGLLADPVAELHQLAGIAGVELTDAQCAELWAELGGKPLEGMVGHFWNPRAGKWQEHLSPWHRDVVLATRLPEYASALGYEIPSDGFTASNKPATESILEETIAKDAELHVLMGKPVPDTPANRVSRDEETGLVLVARVHYEHAGRRLIRDPDLAALVRAGFWHRCAGAARACLVIADVLEEPQGCGVVASPAS